MPHQEGDGGLVTVLSGHKKSPTHRAFPGVDRSLPPLLATSYYARQAFSLASARCSQTVGGRLTCHAHSS